MRDQHTLNRRVLGGIDKGDDTIERSCLGKGIAEVEVVVIRQSHTAKDDLVGLSAHRHGCHHLIVWLIRVSEEGDLLSRDEGIIEVDAGDTGCNQL